MYDRAGTKSAGARAFWMPTTAETSTSLSPTATSIATRRVRAPTRTAIPTFTKAAQLFYGSGKGIFRDISDEAGPYFQERHVGRGAAMWDYDNDGAMDIAVNHCGEQAGLLHNETHSPHHWIRLQLEGTRHLGRQTQQPGCDRRPREGEVGGRTLGRHVKGGGSYLSGHDRRLLIGLGSAQTVDDVEVRWPNAETTLQHFGPLTADQSYMLVEGGRPSRRVALRSE